MAAQTLNVDKKTIWGGAFPPFRASYGKMMMWFFLLTDALTFTGFLTAYGYARHMYPHVEGDPNSWAVAEEVFTHFPFLEGHHPLLYVALMTFILIMSSVTMVLAVEAGHRNDKKGVITWMALTIVGGLIFLGSQAWEWYHFIHGTAEGVVKPIIENGKEVVKHIHGANLQHNEYGHPLFADFFFFITGFHGTHVLSGVIINIVIFVNVLMGTYERRGHYEMVEKVGLYWHFVDLVWVFVFTFFYLI